MEWMKEVHPKENFESRRIRNVGFRYSERCVAANEGGGAMVVSNRDA